MRDTTKTDRVMEVISGGGTPAPAAQTGEARDIETITAQILAWKSQAGGAILSIGQALIDAKAMLPHGEWLPWLENRVEFSAATAQRLMRLAREWTNPAALTDLGRAKAFALLALPPGEREAFIDAPHVVADGTEKTVREMTSRELEQAIRERDEARKELEIEKGNVQEWRTRARDVETEKDKAIKRAESAEADLIGAQTRLRENKNLRARVEQLEQIAREYNDLKSKPVDVAVETKVVRDEAAIEQAVKEAREKEKKKREKVEAERDRNAAEAQKERTRAEAAEKEAETLRAEKKEAEEAAKRDAARSATPERAAVSYLVESMSADLNRLYGYLKKARESGDETLAGAIREAAKAWMKGLEEMTK